jgi:acyl-CoA thioesterase-1
MRRLAHRQLRPGHDGRMGGIGPPGRRMPERQEPPRPLRSGAASAASRRAPTVCAASAVVLGLLALASPLVAQGTEQPPALHGVRRIVALGDSITEAGGAPGGYVWLLERTLRVLYPRPVIGVVNAGIGGQQAPDMAARFQKDVLDRRPQLVTISVGVNDVWRAFRDFQAGRAHVAGDLPGGVPLPAYLTHVAAMVQAARQAGVRVVLVSPTLIYEDLEGPENARLVRYVDALRALAQERGVLFADAHTPFREVIAAYQTRAGRGMDLLTTDGVHLNPAGNRLLAWVILRTLGVAESDLAAIRSLK